MALGCGVAFSLAQLGEPIALSTRARFAALSLMLAATFIRGIVGEPRLLRVHDHVSAYLVMAKIGLCQKRQVHWRKRRDHVLLAISLFDQLVIALG